MFSDVEDIEVKVSHREGASSLVTPWSLERVKKIQNLSDAYISCNKSNCQSGGVYLTSILQEMIKNGQTEIEKEMGCRGQDKSGKWCINCFKIKVSIKYKEKKTKHKNAAI